MTWTLHAGNCLDPVTGMATLADDSVDHVITDPPFEVEAHTQQRRLKPAGWRATGLVRTAPLRFVAITSAQRDAVAAHSARLARRWILVFCQIEASHLWRAALEAHGAVYKRTGIWRKPNGQPQLTGDRPGMGYETIVIAHARGRSRWNGGGHHAVWEFNTANAILGTKASDHQTEKPLGLMETLVRDFTDPGELVCDPFAGSGTTGVAARRLGRSFVGWELDPKYADVAHRRIGETTEQTTLALERAPRQKQSSLDL